MDYSVDWLSFTVPFATIDPRNSHLLGVVAESAVEDFLGGYFHALLDNQPFDILRGRAPYAQSWGREDGGVRFFASPQIPHVLIEITGTGCLSLRKHKALESVLSLATTRLSRLDLAIDIKTDVTPSEFATMRDVERFKAIGDIRSETGETYYVGSMKSERFARVYRYAPPHPRNDTLRIEHVFRRDAAKMVGRQLLENGYASVVAGVGGVYGWAHEIWSPIFTKAADLSVSRMKREEKTTVRWLYGSVASAAAKAVKRGDLDLEAWFEHIRLTVK